MYGYFYFNFEAAEFKRGRESVQMSTEGRPKSVTTPEIIEKNHYRILENQLILYGYQNNASGKFVRGIAHGKTVHKISLTHHHWWSKTHLVRDLVEWFSASICDNGWNLDSLLDTKIETIVQAVGGSWFFSFGEDIDGAIGGVLGVGLMECKSAFVDRLSW